VEARLDTADLPPLDLLIRTSGEHRLSNFLLWQAAYAELLFVDTLWPDFDAAVLQAAVDAFGARERRYGGL
jgi:undecaprenyl diphosphate synthase